MQIKRITRYSSELLRDFNLLLPQLTKDRILSASELRAILADKNVYLLGLYDGKRLVGTASLIILNQIAGAKGMVEDVVVDAGYRGRGLGEGLMIELITFAKKKKLRKVALTSGPDRKAAHALYNKLGFLVKDTTVFQLKLNA